MSSVFPNNWDEWDPDEAARDEADRRYGENVLRLNRQTPNLDPDTVHEIASSNDTDAVKRWMAERFDGAIRLASQRRGWEEMDDKQRESSWMMMPAWQQRQMIQMGFRSPEEIYAEREARPDTPLGINLGFVPDRLTLPDSFFGIRNPIGDRSLGIQGDGGILPGEVRPFGSGTIGDFLGDWQHDVAEDVGSGLELAQEAWDKTVPFANRLLLDRTWSQEHDREITLNELTRAEYEQRHGKIDDAVWFATREEALRQENKGESPFQGVAGFLLGERGSNFFRDLDPDDPKNEDLRGPDGVEADQQLLEVMLDLRDEMRDSAGMGDSYGDTWNRTFHGDEFFTGASEAEVARLNLHQGGSHMTDEERAITRYYASGNVDGETVDGVEQYLIRRLGMEPTDADFKQVYQETYQRYWGDDSDPSRQALRSQQIGVLANNFVTPGRIFTEGLLRIDKDEVVEFAGRNIPTGRLASGGFDAFTVMAMDPLDRVTNQIQAVRRGSMMLRNADDISMVLQIGHAWRAGQGLGEIPDVLRAVDLGASANRRIMQVGDLGRLHPIAQDALTSRNIKITNLADHALGPEGQRIGVRGNRYLVDNFDEIRAGVDGALDDIAGRAPTSASDRIALEAAEEGLEELRTALDEIEFVERKLRIVNGTIGALGRHYDLYRGAENTIHLSGAQRQFEFLEAIADALKQEDKFSAISSLMPRGLNAAEGLIQYDDLLRRTRGFGVQGADDIGAYFQDTEHGLRSIMRGQFGQYEAPFFSLPYQSKPRRIGTAVKEWGVRAIDWSAEGSDMPLHIQRVFGLDVPERVGMGLARAQNLLKPAGHFMRLATSHVPHEGFVNLVGDDFVAEVDRLFRIGHLGRNPMSKERRLDYMNRAIASSDVVTRRGVILQFLDEVVQRSGIKVDSDHYRELVSRLDSHSFSVGDIDRTSLHDIEHRAAVLPDVQTAHGVKSLDLSEFFQWSRKAVLFQQFYGVANGRAINWFMQKAWKPGVLLRVGFPFRAGGEEAISFILRANPIEYLRAQAALYAERGLVDATTGQRVVQTTLPLRAITGGVDFASWIARKWKDVGDEALTGRQLFVTAEDMAQARATAHALQESRFFSGWRDWMASVAKRNGVSPASFNAMDEVAAFAHFHAAFATEWLRKQARGVVKKIDPDTLEAAEFLYRDVGFQSAVLSDILGTSSFESLLYDPMDLRRHGAKITVIEDGQRVTRILNPKGWTEHVPEAGQSLFSDLGRVTAYRYQLQKLEDSQISQAILGEYEGALSKGQIARVNALIPAKYRIALAPSDSAVDDALEALVSTDRSTGRIVFNHKAIREDWKNRMAWLADDGSFTGAARAQAAEQMGIDPNLLYQWIRDNGGLDTYEEFLRYHEEGLLRIADDVDPFTVRSNVDEEVAALDHALDRLGIDRDEILGAAPSDIDPDVPLDDLGLNQLRRVAATENIPFRQTDTAATIRSRINRVRNGTVTPQEIVYDVASPESRRLGDLQRFARELHPYRDDLRKILRYSREEVDSALNRFEHGSGLRSGTSDLDIVLSDLLHDLRGPRIDYDDLRALNGMDRGTSLAVISDVGPRDLDADRRAAAIEAAIRRLNEDDMRHYLEISEHARSVGGEAIAQPLKAGNHRWLTPLVPRELHEAIFEQVQQGMPISRLLDDMAVSRAEAGLPALSDAQAELVTRIYGAFDPYMTTQVAANSDGYMPLSTIIAKFDPADSTATDDLNAAIDALAVHNGLSERAWIQGFYDVPDGHIPPSPILGGQSYGSISWAEVKNLQRINPNAPTAAEGVRNMASRAHDHVLAHLGIDPTRDADTLTTNGLAAQHQAGMSTNENLEILHEILDPIRNDHDKIFDTDILTSLDPNRAPLAVSGPDLQMVVDENPWNALVRTGFDGYVGPAISHIAREPMFLHLFRNQLQNVKKVLGTEMPAHWTEIGERIARNADMEDIHELHRVWRIAPSWAKDLDDPLNYSDFIERLNAHITKIDESPLPTDTRALSKLLDISPEDYDDLLRYSTVQSRYQRMITDVAIDRAMSDAVPFIDDHRFKSQFAVINRNLAPFWFAQEQFYKRWMRTVYMSPQSIRRGQIMLNGLRSSGFLTRDRNGEEVYVIPGAEGLWDTVANLPILSHIINPAGIEMPGTLSFRAEHSMPGLNSDAFGREGLIPQLGPVGVIPILGLNAAFGDDFEPIETFTDLAVGDIQQSAFAMGAGYSLMPSWMSRAFDYTFNTGRYQEEQARARMNAMQAMTSQGMKLDEHAALLRSGDMNRTQVLNGLGIGEDTINEWIDKHQIETTGDQAWSDALEAEARVFVPPEDATPRDMETHIAAIRDWTRYYMGSRFALGFMTPATPTWDAGQDQYQLRQEFNDLLEYMEYEDAIAAIKLRHPGSAPLFVSQSETESGAYIPPVQKSLEWLQSNEGFVEEFPRGAAWLVAQNGERTDSLARNAYNVQLEMGLRARRDPDDFYEQIIFQRDAEPYFARRKEYELAKYRAQDADERRRLETTWNNWSAAYKAGHPVFEAHLSRVDNQDKVVLDEIREAVNSPNAPDELHLNLVRDLIEEYDAFSDQMQSIRGLRGKEYDQRRRRLKLTFLQTGNALAEANPSLRNIWNSLVKTQADLRDLEVELEAMS